MLLRVPVTAFCPEERLAPKTIPSLSSFSLILTFLRLGLCTQTHIFVLVQHSENDGLVAVWTALCPAAAVELVDLQLAEVHGQLTELALARVLLDFLGLWEDGAHGPNSPRKLKPIRESAGKGQRQRLFLGGREVSSLLSIAPRNKHHDQKAT